MKDAPFADRAAAGQILAAEVAQLQPESPVVYALPRGGVPVALPIAEALSAPLDLLMVRKLGVPWQPELAAGAVVEGDPPDIVLNENVVQAANLGVAELEAAAAAELKVIELRRALYLPGRASIAAARRTAILVDDGIATGASMRAAIAAMKRRDPKRIVVAVPVAAHETIENLRPLVDEIVCLRTPERFGAVGFYYQDFRQLSDEDVVRLLSQAPTESAS